MRGRSQGTIYEIDSYSSIQVAILSDEAFRQMVFDIDAAFLATGKACRLIDQNRTHGATRRLKAIERERDRERQRERELEISEKCQASGSDARLVDLVPTCAAGPEGARVHGIVVASWTSAQPLIHFVSVCQSQAEVDAVTCL